MLINNSKNIIYTGLVVLIIITLLTSCVVAKRLTKPPYPGIAKLAVGYVIVKNISFKKE